MNRRGFLSLSLLAPVAGVMAARDAMAAPQFKALTFGRVRAGFVSRNEMLHSAEMHWQSTRSCVGELMEACGGGEFPRDAIPNISTRVAEDESVLAQFMNDLALLQEPESFA
jgi:hypothetical protein